MGISEFGLEPGEVEKIQMILSNHPEIDKAIVYGSRAKGNYKPYSDIDISLVGNINLTLQQKIEVELDDLLLPYKFDISIYNQIENQELIEHIGRVGKEIYTSCKSPNDTSR